MRITSILSTLLLWIIASNSSSLFCQNTKINVLRGDIYLDINPYKRTVRGEVIYRFVVEKPTDTFTIDARDMKIDQVLLNHRKAKYIYTQNKIYILSHYKTKRYQASISYTAQPKKSMYFIGWKSSLSKNQVWTQGQGKNNSHWVPSFDDASEKIKFTIKIHFQKGYTVLSNGLLKKKKDKKNYTLWEYKLRHPVSSYLLAIAIGQYSKFTTQSKEGIPLEYYFYPEDSIKAKSTYKYSKTIFDLMTSRIGVGYPWEIYRDIPVRDFIHGGMENTTLTIFPDTDMVDNIGNNDKNFIETEAHELAHHWFGNSLTAKNSSHHWLHEGFATYYSSLIQDQILSNKIFEWQLFKIITQLPNQNKSLLTDKGSSFLYYQKGAYVLHLLSEELGELSFRKGLQNYINTYKFGSVDTDSFIKIMEAQSGKDLSEFKQTWITSDRLNHEEVLKDIMRHPFLRELIQIITSKDKKLIPSNDYNLYKNIVILSSWRETPSKEAIAIYKKGLHLKSSLSQNYALHCLDSIPKELKMDTELLLKASSYQTIALALDKLCKSFKTNISLYLKKTEHILGLSDKNVRFIWLKWAIKYHYKGFQEKWKEELFRYTQPNQPYLVRENAYKTIDVLGLPLSLEVIKGLVQGCTHHFYSFRNFCRDVFKKRYQTTIKKSQLYDILNALSEEEQVYLRTNFLFLKK